MLIYDTYEVGSRASQRGPLPSPEKGLIASCQNGEREFLQATDGQWTSITERRFGELLKAWK